MPHFRISFFLLAFSLLTLGQPLQFSNQVSKDPGAQIIAKLKGSLIYASNNNSPEGAKVSNKEIRDLISAQTKINYKEYYQIGTDQTSVYRSYETWLKPIEKSDTLMLSCEPKSISEDGIKFDINFWQSNKKIFSTVSEAKYGAPLIITGPSWRNGKLLYILELKK